MKILTPGHKYEVNNLEPNSPANDVSKGLRKEAYELCQAIEACGCSEQVTNAVVLASALGEKIGALEAGNQTIQFIEKRPVENGEPGQLETVNNGTTNEELMEVLIDRLQFLYAKLPSDETARSIHHLKEALAEQKARTERRKKRNVEGTNLK